SRERRGIAGYDRYTRGPQSLKLRHDILPQTRARRIRLNKIRPLIKPREIVFHPRILHVDRESCPLRVEREVASSARAAFDRSYAAESRSQRQRKKADAGVQIERHLAAIPRRNCFHEAVDQEAVDLKERPRADAKYSSRRCVIQRFHRFEPFVEAAR